MSATKHERNEEIRQRHAAGESQTALAHAYNLNPSRIRDILDPAGAAARARAYRERLDRRLRGE